MRILWTMPYLPWPITSGGKARQYHLLEAMAKRGHAITLLVQSKTPADAAVHRALSPLLEQLIVLPRRSLRHPRTLWHALTSPMPLLATVNGHAPALSQCFDELLSRGHWDVVQIEHSYGFAAFERSLAARQQGFVITEHNVESELGAATYGKWPWWARPWAWLDQRRAERWERHVLPQAEAVIAVTPSDATTLAAISGRPAHVVSNGVDTAAFAGAVPDHQACAALFVGNFEYAPNVDALRWLLSDIMPRLWLQVPLAKLLLCGHALPMAWRREFNDSRIEWRGYVDQLSTVQAQASVFVAPLRFGGGSKLKVLEAMAGGLPVVSTGEGLSGLPVQDGVQALRADTAQAQADALARVLLDPALAMQLGQAARQFVTGHFDWQASAAQMEAAYEALPHGQVPGVAA